MCSTTSTRMWDHLDMIAEKEHARTLSAIEADKERLSVVRAKVQGKGEGNESRRNK